MLVVRLALGGTVGRRSPLDGGLVLLKWGSSIAAVAGCGTSIRRNTLNKGTSLRHLSLGVLCILCTGVASASTINLSTGVATYTITSDSITETPDAHSVPFTAVPVTSLPASPYTHDTDVTNTNGVSSTTWVAPAAAQATESQTVSGTVVYQVQFTLTSTAGAELYISFAADDYVSLITLNSDTIFTSGGTEAWASQTNVADVTSDFVVGTNTIDFTVPNYRGDGASSCCGPTGLIAAVDVTTAPEPATLGETGLCLIGLASMLRRRLAR